MKRDLFASAGNGQAHMAEMESMMSPQELRALLPQSGAAFHTVSKGRCVMRNILARRDPRLLVVVGPCSIHDPQAALEYARRLRHLADEVADTLFLVMRVYLEKPRTRIGWKGLINDPRLDNSCRIEQGMVLARQLLLEINELGVPAAIEALDPLSPQYLHDLVSWAAIGARTTESQPHRELASILPFPVGFKNGTGGEVGMALNAIFAAASAHAFLGIGDDGRAAILRSSGNAHGHLVLRGGSSGPNYDRVSVANATQAMQQAGLAANIVIDCAHANSNKNHLLQERVLQDVVQQIVDGDQALVGVMLESFLESGQQDLADRSQLRYGCSVTDACIDWPATQTMLHAARQHLQPQVAIKKRMMNESQYA